MATPGCSDSNDFSFAILSLFVFVFVQGASKKMSDSDFNLKSVPGVGFYFFRGVLDSEFRA